MKTFNFKTKAEAEIVHEALVGLLDQAMSDGDDCGGNSAHLETLDRLLREAQAALRAITVPGQ